MASPKDKRIKLDNLDSPNEIFCSFYNDSRCLKHLTQAIEWLDNPPNGFCALKVLNCNADQDALFTDAKCKVSRNTEHPDKLKNFGFAGIFQRGFEMFESYLVSPEALPKRRGERLAFQRLLEFLTNDLEDCQNSLDVRQLQLSKANWEVRLAHHMLSKLAANQNYILDNVHKFHKADEPLTCPCCEEKIVGKYGDTSIGATSVWHGYVDILLGTGTGSVPVNVNAETEPDSPLENESSFEINRKEEKSFKQQIISEAIVFSFLQKKTNPDCDNFLIPTIGITKEAVFIYMYDCENDILLESVALELFSGNKLFVGTVLAVWLAVNYQYFCSGVPTSIKELDFSADFLKKMKPVCKIYQEDVKHGCGNAKSTDQDVFRPDYILGIEYDRGDFKRKRDRWTNPK